MDVLRLLSLSIICILSSSIISNASTTFVSSQQEFDDAHDSAAENDTIVWRSGTYASVYMDISKNNLFIASEKLGSTVFTGASRVNISGDFITLEGFQFLDGDIGTKDVINITGSHLHINQLNIRAYRSYKYLRVREQSQYVDITYCNFENRLNLDDQNILSILVDDNQPGYHKIQHCSFKNFDGSGNDLGIEPIRIGLSTQADRASRSLVEYCYFTQCNGDGEIISSKASENVYRFNTFEDNPKAELVLRHGSKAIVYGNFFLNGKGGVRVREGQNHYIYNNYFYELDDRTIFLQNEKSDPLSRINIAFNTIISSSEVILGGDGNNPPRNVVIANNIFAEPDDVSFKEATEEETWIGNVASSALGITMPSRGIRTENPGLEENSAGFFGLSANSSSINAALPGYETLPQFPGMDEVDVNLLLDLMGQSRPSSISQKDIGSNEYPHEILIQPIATEENTGPSYNSSVLTSVKDPVLIVQDLIKISPNPVSDLLNVRIQSANRTDLRIDIFDTEGRRIYTIAEEPDYQGDTTLSHDITQLQSGMYTIRATIKSDQERTQKMQTIKFIKSL